MNEVVKIKLISHLSQFATEERVARFEEVIQNRTRHLTVVLEDIYQSHNISAVLRTCDCLGVQDVQVIEKKNEFLHNEDIALGATKWLTINRYKKSDTNTLECINNLKKHGYSIVATTPHQQEVLLNDLDITKKTALVFGTELTGISNEIIDMADGFVKIPMAGFTESFNISVSAAICMFSITEKLRHSDVDWRLSDTEKRDIMLQWLRESIKSSALIEKKFMQSL